MNLPVFRLEVRLRWLGAILHDLCKLVVLLASLKFPIRIMCLGSQRQMLHNDINYVNVKNEKAVYTKQKYKNFNFQQFLFN